MRKACAQARELNDLIENYRGEHLGDVQAMRDPSKVSGVFFQLAAGGADHSVGI